jgi:hypothetical protein
MEFTGKKIKGLPVFTPAVMELRRKVWDKIKDGQTFKTSLVVPRKGKSQAQLGLIWGNMIANTVLQAEDQGIGVDDLMVYFLNSDLPKGQAITSDYLHQLIYVICPTTDIDGNKVTLRDMNTQEASSLFKRFQAIIAGAGIIIDDPPEIE